MAVRNFSSNAAETTLAGAITDASTSLVVAATTGFPAPPFTLAVDAGAASQELVLVTGVAGTTLTVTRGYDSTTASAHDTGAVVQHAHGAIDFTEANAHVNASSSVHGLTGSVVGTSDTQTLTGKTLDLTENTLTGTAAEFKAAMSDDDFATLAGVESLSNKTLVSPTITGGAWASYSPAKTGLSTSAQEAYYKQVGKTVTVSYVGTLSGAVTAEISVALPVAAARTPIGYLPVGSVHALDAGTIRRNGQALISDTDGTLRFFSDNSATAWNATGPFTWASGDQIAFTITYEAV